MPSKAANITADAVALQERDEFNELGWVKVIAPAKVNLHLAIGQRREDGYHDAATIMHAINLHDMLYLRRKLPDAPDFGSNVPSIRMVTMGDAPAPEVAPEDNLAYKAVMRLAEAMGLAPEETDLELRIVKNIPAQGGLGGGSTDAAAALAGAAHLWGTPLEVPRSAGASDEAPGSIFAHCEAVARTLGADVAFFLRGGCAYHEGTGDAFVHSLLPSRKTIVLVKPEGGVSTAEAYKAFDEHPSAVTPEQAQAASAATEADQVALFNNLAPASEQLMPQLAEIRTWLTAQPGVDDALLCGSGATTFAPCQSFSLACQVVAEARKRGWWARATSLGAARVAVAQTGN